MKIANRHQPHLPQPFVPSGRPDSPEPQHPKDQVNLSERIGSAVIRGAKVFVPGGLAGLAGGAIGTAGYYTTMLGIRSASMVTSFPQLLAVSGALGAGAASLVEAAAGEGTQASLTRAALTGGAIGAAAGVIAQVIIWSRPF